MATDINNVVLVGRLVRDIEIRYTTSGAAIGNGSIAVKRSRKTGDEWKDEVSYFDFSVYGKTAENLKPYLTQGRQIAIAGHLRQELWTDKEGNKRSLIRINADDLQLLADKKSSGNNSNDYDSNGYEGSDDYNNVPLGYN